MAEGWFAIPGVQDGPRTLAEQMTGLDAALAEASGKSVLDLGCAEGLIALEFAKAGAASVFGYDYNADLIEVARSELAKAGQLPVRFYQANMSDMVCGAGGPTWDIVLALAVLHKLLDPAAGVRFCAKLSRSLIVIRLPAGSTGKIRGKHSGVDADVPVILAECGFKRERKEAGPRGEWVQYWRRC